MTANLHLMAGLMDLISGVSFPQTASPAEPGEVHEGVSFEDFFAKAQKELFAFVIPQQNLQDTMTPFSNPVPESAASGGEYRLWENGLPYAGP